MNKVKIEYKFCEKNEKNWTKSKKINYKYVNMGKKFVKNIKNILYYKILLEQNYMPNSIGIGKK